MQLFACSLYIVALLSPSKPVVLPSDLDTLVGSSWAGTLTYRDYSSGKRTSIQSTLYVKKVVGKVRSWEFSIGYPKEPDHNESEIVALSTDGRKLHDEMVTERKVSREGVIQITTEKLGKDDGASVRMRFVYLISAKTCSIQKLVRPLTDKVFQERNIYQWQRS